MGSFNDLMYSHSVCISSLWPLLFCVPLLPRHRQLTFPGLLPYPRLQAHPKTAAEDGEASASTWWTRDPRLALVIDHGYESVEPLVRLLGSVEKQNDSLDC